MTRTTCGQCVYWEPPEEGSEGRLGNCRRSPPLHEYWPVTLPEDWCGQARAREPEPEAQSVVEAAQFVVLAWRRLMLAVEHQHPYPIPTEGALVDTAIADLEKALERVKP